MLPSYPVVSSPSRPVVLFFCHVAISPATPIFVATSRVTNLTPFVNQSIRQRTPRRLFYHLFFGHVARAVFCPLFCQLLSPLALLPNFLPLRCPVATSPCRTPSYLLSWPIDQLPSCSQLPRCSVARSSRCPSSTQERVFA
jgi:hypothetical protein